VTTEEDVSDADEIALWVYGEEGNTGPLVLWSGDQNGKFQAANTDDFKVRMFELLSYSQVCVFHSCIITGVECCRVGLDWKW